MKPLLITVALMAISTLSLPILFDGRMSQADVMIRVFGKIYGRPFAFIMRGLIFILSPLLLVWLISKSVAALCKKENSL